MAGIVELSSSPSDSDSDDVETSSLPPISDANEIDADALKKDLDECLTNIESDGSFALSKAASTAPNPGLFIKSAGTIGLPLSDRDAQAIVEASHEAPFGKGEETLVDTSIRRTWEISSSDFELKNPAWQPFVESIVAEVSAGLGLDATGNGVTAELYKLLLYEEGAMFKPHQE